MGSYDEAVETVETLRRLDADATDLSLQLAHIRMKEKNWDAAMEICDRELMVAPRNASIYRARAMVFTRTAQYDKALAQIERARELGAEEESLEMESLEALCGAGKKEEAYRILDRVIRRNSPVTEHFLSESAKEEYPILTSMPDFASFLEERHNF